MIDYIVLLLAIMCFTAQFAFTKLYESAVRQTMVTALVMLIVTSLIGMLLFLFIGGFHVQTTRISVILAVLFALVMIPYYMIGIRVLSLGSLAIYSMFMMLGGMLVPFFYGIIFLHETISIGKILGTVLLSLFIILQAIGQNSPTENHPSESTKKRKHLFFVFCLLIFLLNGLTGVIAKAHQISEGAVDEISFTVISCGSIATLSLVLLIFAFLKNQNEKFAQVKTILKRRPLWIMVLLGSAAYAGNFLHLKAASNIPASVQFPLVSGGVIVLSALVSAFLFKEKISKKEWISVAGAFASTILFAF